MLTNGTNWFWCRCSIDEKPKFYLICVVYSWLYYWFYIVMCRSYLADHVNLFFMWMVGYHFRWLHMLVSTLRWRRNGHGVMSNHQPHHCLLNHLFGCRSKKTSKLCVTGLCAGNSPGTAEFPPQMASNAENVSIWWRHHELRDVPGVSSIVCERLISIFISKVCKITQVIMKEACCSY